MPERNLRFQQKLWHIVSSCKTGAVYWNNAGDSVVFKFPQFKREYLDRNVNFCKSNKIASFVRQLNLYGFRKLVKSNTTKRKFVEEHEFKNTYFRRGRKDLLEYVVRSSTSLAPPITRKSRGRRKIKYEVTVENDIDCYYRKFLENRIPRMSKYNKENEFYPTEKYSVCNSCNSPKNIISIYRMTNSVPVIPRHVLGDCGNTRKLQNNVLLGGNQKPFDFGIMKKELPDENIKFEPVKLKTEVLEIKPTDQTFANLDDDFDIDSEDTNDAEEEFYQNMVDNVNNYEKYLNEPVIFKEEALSSTTLNNSVKLNNISYFEKSKEQIELEDAYKRVNGQPRLNIYCVCNPNIPPSWMFSSCMR